MHKSVALKQFKRGYNFFGVCDAPQVSERGYGDGFRGGTAPVIAALIELRERRGEPRKRRPERLHLSFPSPW